MRRRRTTEERSQGGGDTGSLHAQLAKLPLTGRSVHRAVWEGRASSGFGLSGDLGPHRYDAVRAIGRHHTGADGCSWLGGSEYISCLSDSAAIGYPPVACCTDSEPCADYLFAVATVILMIATTACCK